MQLSERHTPKLPTEQRQASLVQAAVRLAAERSPAEVTTADLAQAVGITQGAVFRHFSSKEAVWLAVLDWTADSLLGELQAAAAAAPHPLAALQAVFKAHVDFVIRHPGVPRLIFQELQHAGDTPLKARVRSLMQRYRALVIGLMEQAHGQGQLQPQADLEAATVLFIGSVQGLVMQALVSGQVAGLAALAPRVFRHFLFGFALEQTHSVLGQMPVDMERANG
jgi:TetR/AcrR family transcriptional regulator